MLSRGIDPLPSNHLNILGLANDLPGHRSPIDERRELSHHQDVEVARIAPGIDQQLTVVIGRLLHIDGLRFLSVLVSQLITKS